MWRDLWEKFDAGKRNENEKARHQSEEAYKELKRWMKYCGADGTEPPHDFNDQVHALILRGVLSSNSWLAVFMITDVFGTEGRFNVPGAVSESNWTCRLDKTVAELDNDPHLLHKTQMFAKLVKETHRTA
jgi:4-alpha-glucanotransferase